MDSLRLIMRYSHNGCLCMMFTELPARKKNKLYVSYHPNHISAHRIISEYVSICQLCHSILGYHILSYPIISRCLHIFISSLCRIINDQRISTVSFVVAQTSASSFAAVSGLAVPDPSTNMFSAMKPLVVSETSLNC